MCVLVYSSLLGTFTITYLTCGVFMLLNSKNKVMFGRLEYPTLINENIVKKNIFNCPIIMLASDLIVV